MITEQWTAPPESPWIKFPQTLVDKAVRHAWNRRMGFEPFVRGWHPQEGGVHEPYLKQTTSHGGTLLASLLVTAGRVMRHEDAEELPQFSYHAIIRNDGYIAIGGAQSYKAFRPQIIGTVICVDIHQEHQVRRDMRIARSIEHYESAWASLCFNVHHPMPPESVQDRFSEAFQQYLEIETG